VRIQQPTEAAPEERAEPSEYDRVCFSGLSKGIDAYLGMKHAREGERELVRATVDHEDHAIRAIRSAHGMQKARLLAHSLRPYDWKQYPLTVCAR
jgi:hypothetical protein